MYHQEGAMGTPYKLKEIAERENKTELEVINEALLSTTTQEDAASKLGMTRATLYRNIKRLKARVVSGASKAVPSDN